MNFRNFTPHNLVVFSESGEKILDIASEGVARVKEVVSRRTSIDGIEIVKKQYLDVEGVPDSESGTWLVVSKMVMDAAPSRVDLLCPDTGPDSSVRDEQGRIAGVRRLQMQLGAEL